MRVGNGRIAGLVIFLLTLADLIYLTRSDQAGGSKNLVLALMTLLVVGVTLGPLWLYHQAVQDAHDRVAKKELARLRREEALHMNVTDHCVASTYWLLRGIEVAGLSGRPQLSGLTRVTRAALIVVAIASFGASLVQIFVA
jgi:FtsH-binding integral membrane protein